MHSLLSTSPLQASCAAHATAATAPSGRSSMPSALASQGTWQPLAALSQRLHEHQNRQQFVVLNAGEQALLGLVLSEVDPQILPPDQQHLLEQQVEVFAKPATGATTVMPEQLSPLTSLLDVVMSAYGQLEQDEWGPRTEEDLRPVRELADWMRMTLGTRADLGSRSEIGRLLLSQSAGLRHEFHIGSDLCLPQLPPGHTLHQLLAARTRVHVTLQGVPAQFMHLEDSLNALPLRTWRLTHLIALESLIDPARANLRTLDLTEVGSPLSEEDLALIRRAADTFPNLHQILLPDTTSDLALGAHWKTTPSSGGLRFTRKDRPDGLALLDQAVSQWTGYYLGTRMAIRHTASTPESARLLRFATTLGQEGIESRAGQQLLNMLTRAAGDADARRACAALIDQQEGQQTNPKALMDLIDRTFSSQRPTGMALPLRADSLPAVHVRPETAPDTRSALIPLEAIRQMNAESDSDDFYPLSEEDTEVWNFIRSAPLNRAGNAAERDDALDSSASSITNEGSELAPSELTDSIQWVHPINAAAGESQAERPTGNGPRSLADEDAWAQREQVEIGRTHL
jgi:hypothetical protein